MLKLERFADHLLNVWEIKKITNIQYAFIKSDYTQVRLSFDYKYHNKWYSVICSQIENYDIVVYVHSLPLNQYVKFGYSKHARFLSWGGFTNRINKAIRDGGLR